MAQNEVETYDYKNTWPEDGAIDTCDRCKRPIIWYPDSDEAPYGFWYDQEHGTEACTPGENDENHYHFPKDED